MAEINNTLSNTLLSGTSGDDSIRNGWYEKSDVSGGNYVTIIASDGNDFIYNNRKYGASSGGNNSSIDGGTGNDSIKNYGSSVKIDGGAGNDSISNYYGNSLTIDGGTGNDSIYNDYGSKVTIDSGDGNDSIRNYDGKKVLIDGGAGNDSINNDSSNVTIKGGNDNDTITNSGDSVTIDAGTGNDDIWNDGDNVTINGDVGNDQIENYGDNSITIDGGAGYDTIINNCDSALVPYDDSDGSYVLFKYNSGDGSDIIYGFRADSTLSISGGSYSTTKSGNDVIVTVGDGKISLIGAASLSKVNIKGDKTPTPSPEKNSWRLNGTTATYGTSSKTLVTVKGVKSTEGLSVSGKVVTVSKSALGTAKVTISDGYTLKLGSDVTAPKTAADDWTHDGTKATYKSSSTTAGYVLASNGKSITYSKAKAASTLATVNGVKSNVNPAVNGKVITLTKANLSANKVTVGGSGYEFNFAKGDYKKTAITGSANKDIITSRGNNLSVAVGKGNDTVKVLGNKTTITGGAGNDLISLDSAAKNNLIVYSNGDGNDLINGLTSDDTIKIASGTAKVTTSGNDVIFTVGKGKITVKDAANKTFSYIANGKTETYSTVSPNPNDGDPYIISKDGKGITLSSSYSDKTFEAEDYSKLVTINAAAVTKGTDILGNNNANKIIGGKGNDTLEGLIGNDTLTGGKGADVFTYYDGDGKDVITDYAEEDTIYIASGKVNSISKKSNDVILNVKGDENGTVTVKKALTKGITYIDEDNFEHDCIKGKETVLTKDKNVTITKNYWKNDVDIARYGDNLKTVDASAVTHSLTITGNDKANQIIGSKKNDTIIGGESDDTLYGDDGADIFVYRKGDGDDYIVDYKEEDKIQLINVDLSGNSQADGNDLIFKFVGSSGKIRVKDGAGKNISFIDADGKSISTEHITPNFLAEDDNFDMSNQLSSIVQSKAADYSFLSTSNNLAKKDNLIAYSGKK